MPYIQVLENIEKAEAIMKREGKTVWYAGVPGIDPRRYLTYATAEENIKLLAEAGIPFRLLPKLPRDVPTHREFPWLRTEMAKPIVPEEVVNFQFLKNSPGS